ncbi:MAG TPA: LuxR C-terminal-related transcriptional regulator, partial [Marmoricola sp.]
HLGRSNDGFQRAAAPYEAARTLFVAGAALRRAGRRSAAAEMLTAASDTFLSLGALRWKGRADQELRRARPRVRTDHALTTSEQRVASLVVAGRTNREVAAQLYTSVGTVEAHLTRIYRKIGVRSRTELAGAVADGRVCLE